MRAAARVPSSVVPTRCSAARITSASTAGNRVLVSRRNTSSKQQNPNLRLQLPSTVARNNGIGNAAKWFREVLRRGPAGTLKTLLKMDEIRWGRHVGTDQFGNKYDSILWC